MRHRVFGRHLSRDTKGRKALIRSLVSSLVKNEKIITTDSKAKILKQVIDKLITKAKRQTLSARRQLIAQIQNQQIAAKIFDDLALRFTNRQSGFTKVAKLGVRATDKAKISIVEFVQMTKKVADVDSQQLKSKDSISENKSKKAKKALKIN